MAVNFLLKLDGAGIKGESPVDGYSDHMQLDSLRFGGTQFGTFGSGEGGGGGKFTPEDLEFTMKTNKATPKVLEACAKGAHIPTATVVCLKAGGGKAVEYLKVTLSDVFVTKHITEFKSDGDPTSDPVPVDTVRLNYGKIVVEYKEQKSDGSAGPSVEGGWDLKKLKPGK
jgi:type VI secretion system secreted protein Hcp